MAAVVSEESPVLACVMIPLLGTHLLLPSVTVAEIVPWRRVRRDPEQPAWCLGVLGWRGETVPLVQFEVLNGLSAKLAGKPGRCLVVMNRTRRAGGRPFYGLVAAGLPRIVHLTDEDVQNADARLGAAETATVRVGTENAVVPNLSFIEEQVAALKLR
jgi:chemosensory pili system protein ChpC